VTDHPQSGWLHEGPPRGPGALLTDRAQLGHSYGTPAMRPATGAAPVRGADRAAAHARAFLRAVVRALTHPAPVASLTAGVPSEYHLATPPPCCRWAAAHDGTAEPRGVTPPEAVDAADKAVVRFVLHRNLPERHGRRPLAARPSCVPASARMRKAAGEDRPGPREQARLEHQVERKPSARGQRPARPGRSAGDRPCDRKHETRRSECGTWKRSGQAPGHRRGRGS